MYSNSNGSFAQYKGLPTRLHNKPVFVTLKHILKMQILKSMLDSITIIYGPSISTRI